jgi:bacteriorhodopsin
MKHALMPKEPTWWVWLVTTALLATGLVGHRSGFSAAIALSLAQTIFFWQRHRSLQPIGVQIRLTYTLMLAACLAPQLRWLYWLPTVGTSALLVFGYCLLARTLSLLRWNRTEALSFDLLRRTFLTAPVVTRAIRKPGGCGADGGVCELESRVASLRS